MGMDEVFVGRYKVVSIYEHARSLAAQGRMTEAGFRVLDLENGF
jgi:hypothetical protein